MGETGDGRVICWDVITGRHEVSITCGANPAYTLALSKDSKFLATAGHESTVKVWQLATGTLVQALPVSTDWVQKLVFSPDGTRLAGTTCKEGIVHIWDVAAGEEIVTIRGHDRTDIRDLHFSPDGSLIATASLDGTARIWDAQSRPDGTAVLFVGQEGTGDLAVAPDGSRILVQNGGEVVIDDCRSDDFTTIVVDSEKRGFEMALSGDGRSLATAAFRCYGSGAGVRVWDTHTGCQMMSLNMDGTVSCVAYSPDGRLLATALSDHNVYFWDATSGAQLGKLTGHQYRIRAMAFSSDSRFLATGSIDSAVMIWHVESRICATVLSSDTEDVYCLAFSPDGRRLATGHGPKRSAASLSDDENPDSVFLPGLEFCNLRVWEVETGCLVHTIRAHDSCLSSVEFSRDNQRILTASNDGAIKLWDVTTGDEVIALHGHRVYLYDFLVARFSPDNCFIYSVARFGPVRRWDARPMEPSMAARPPTPGCQPDPAVMDTPARRDTAPDHDR